MSKPKEKTMVSYRPNVSKKKINVTANELEHNLNKNAN